MPVIFSINHEDGYFITQYKGEIIEEQALDAWRQFLHSDRWRPGLNELVDPSEAYLGRVSPKALINASKFVGSFYSAHNTSAKVAVYANTILVAGLSRLYSAYTKDSTETVRVFKVYDDAVQWLKENKTYNNLHADKEVRL